jgi:hypothetical protein
MVSPQGKKLTRSGPFLSHKTVAMIFLFDGEVLNFFAVGESVWRHCIDFYLFSGVDEIPKFHLLSQYSPESRRDFESKQPF